jgi:pyruvate formate lyase activating enzyme
MDAAKHEQFTGVSNKTILDNLTRLSGCFPATPIVVRTPLIPGFNTTGKDISTIAKFLKSIKTLKHYQLLPYHRFGTSKYGYLGKVYLFEGATPLDERYLQRLYTELTEELSSSFKISKGKSLISLEPLS